MEKMNKIEIKKLYQSFLDATKFYKDAQVEAEEIRKSIPAIENGSDFIMTNIKVQREARRIAVSNRARDAEIAEIDTKIRELTLDLEKEKDVISGIKQRYDHFIKKVIPQSIQAMNSASNAVYQRIIDDLLAQIPGGFKALVLQASTVASQHGLSYGGHQKFLQNIFPEPSFEEIGKIKKELSKIYQIDI